MSEATQSTFAELEHGAKKRKTRREKFLERMNGLVPWKGLEEAIRPHCPKAGRGRRTRAVVDTAGALRAVVPQPERCRRGRS